MPNLRYALAGTGQRAAQVGAHGKKRNTETHGMGKLFPRLDILPSSQRLLWEELGATPDGFVLYGGTALALRLGHRQSEDFDFFSRQAFDAGELHRAVPYLQGSRVDQFKANTLTCTVERQGPVKVSFFGDLDMLGRLHNPEIIPPGVAVASLADVAATKMRVVQFRAAAKDYTDIAA